MRRHRNRAPWEVRDPLPRDLSGWWSLVRENTTCRMRLHSRPGNRVWKYNGGNTCWLCRYCHLIVKYDSEDRNR
jgi:hypothetical protein